MSGVFPLGGPHQGGTGITLVGGGFPALREMAWGCKIGPVGPTPATLDAEGLREKLQAEEQRRLIAERSYMASVDERGGSGEAPTPGATPGAKHAAATPASNGGGGVPIRPASASWANAAPFRPLGFDASAASGQAPARGVAQSPAGPSRGLLDRFGEAPPLASFLLAPGSAPRKPAQFYGLHK